MSDTTIKSTDAVLIGKHHDITPFASTDATRYAINSVHYNAERQCLEATNGVIAVRVPVCKSVSEFPLATTGKDSLADCILRPETIKKGLANIPKGERLPVLSYAKLSGDDKRASVVATDLDNEQAVTGALIDAQFPKLDQVWPDAGLYELSVCLDAAQLRKLADYAEKHGREVKNGSCAYTPVKLMFKDELSPMLFSVELQTALGEDCRAEGVLMPVRMT